MRPMKSILLYQKKNSRVLGLHSDLLLESFNLIIEINLSETFLSVRKNMTSVSSEKLGKVSDSSLSLSHFQSEEVQRSEKSQPSRESIKMMLKIAWFSDEQLQKDLVQKE